jgi:hypothetical protein
LYTWNITNWQSKVQLSTWKLVLHIGIVLFLRFWMVRILSFGSIPWILFYDSDIYDR